MEGVGARLGRSSSRYGNGSTAVFSGPVRKWKKDWVPISPPSSSSSSSNNSNRHHHHLPSSSSSSLANGADGSVSHLRLFKWTPISQTGNKENSNININTIINNDSPSKDAAGPPRRKFKYIPIAVLEEQKKEAEGSTDDEGKFTDLDEITAWGASKNGGNEKPDINDVPMEENQSSDEEKETAAGRQDLNKSLDLSL